MPRRDHPRLTAHLLAGEFTPTPDSAYIFASGEEERSAHVDTWRAGASVELVEVLEQHPSVASIRRGKDQTAVQLRSESQLAALVGELAATVYLDITGLAHHIWAPLLRALLRSDRRVFGVYVEPGEYTRTPTPTEGTIYDLSERIAGISPLPGFANLRDSRDDDSTFVPLLGFEGTRLIHVVEDVQPSADATVPIIGVPGFRVEYPFVSYKGNRKPLVDGGYWTNVRYATANCPFDLFFTLEQIVVDFGRPNLRVAPIGTKPHGLGAVLFALAAEDRVEIIYDHPIRKPGRTTGSARLCVYDISTFWFSAAARWAER